MTREAVFDIECDGLNPSKIHCLWIEDTYGRSSVGYVSYEDMRASLASYDRLIGHNIIRFDIPVLERLLGVAIQSKLVDTLALSWTLYPERHEHGLESWGEDLHIKKPVVEDWVNQDVEVYLDRCEQDVQINMKLWKKMDRLLDKLYDNDEKKWEYIEYISFKMDCAREQERSRWKLDLDRVDRGISELEQERDAKVTQLVQAMPKVEIYAKRNPPAKPYKKDGTLSTTGARWKHLCKKCGLPENHLQPIDELVGYSEPNPASSKQVKDWLYSLGWKPTTFKYVRDKLTNEVRAIPQVNGDHGSGICDSVKLLYNRDPAIELLDGLSVINHRLSILNGFKENVSEDGYVRAEIQGLTNTLRFKHKVCVNLPKAGKSYGELIRGCLISEDGYELCGSDMASLEDRLKQHFIYPYDPDYVEEMNVKDYDPHLSLAELAGEVTAYQVDKYKSGEDKSIKPIRDIFKNGNYALNTEHIKLCEFRGYREPAILSQAR